MPETRAQIELYLRLKTGKVVRVQGADVQLMPLVGDELRDPDGDVVAVIERVRLVTLRSGDA